VSATPPGGSPPPQPAYGINVPARLPIPGNAEWLVWFVVVVVIAIVAGIAEDVDAHAWVVATTWLTAAYLISRGLAKASRVFEQ
jgi:hypothetical protein